MLQRTTHMSFLVPDQQEAKTYYTEVMGFVLKSDAPFPTGEDARWITVSTHVDDDLEIILQPAEWGAGSSIDERRAVMGRYPGLVISTSDCRGDTAALEAKGVTILSQPEKLPWGYSSLIQDKYGYVHNLLESSFG